MFFTSWISNSFEEDTPTGSQNIPHNNNYHFRDSSSDSSDGEMASPTTPISPFSSSPFSSSVSRNNDITINNNNNNNNNNNTTPNLQRRASESISEAVQFRKLPVRRYTLPGKLGLSKFWEAGRDSSVQVAMVSLKIVYYISDILVIFFLL